MIPLLLQVTSAPNGASESEAWAIIFISIAITAVTLVVVLHGSGLLMKASRQEYWFGVSLGILFLYFGLLASLIYYLYYKYSHKGAGEEYRPVRLPQSDEDSPLLSAQPAYPQQPVGAVRCRNCGAANSSGTDFCGHCGEVLRTVQLNKSCPECYTELPQDAQFCHQCGHRFGSTQRAF